MFKKIGLIGGSGKMGQMFFKAFHNLGLNTITSDENNLKQETELIKSVDLVIVSVPIEKAVEVVNRIGPSLNKNQVLIDFTSIKKNIVPAMKKFSAEAIACHPMFGPMKSIKGQTMIIMPDDNSKKYLTLKKLFESLQLKVVIIKDWREHDKLMSYIQGLMHFIHIVFTRSLLHRGIGIENLMEIASPVYRANFAFACRIIGRDPDLYSHILIDNSHNQVVLADFIQQATETLEIISNKNSKELNKLLLGLKNYLGDFATQFSKESDYLVHQMTNYQKKDEEQNN